MSPRCSSDGCLVRFKVEFNSSISIITSTTSRTSRFVSIVAVQRLAVYSSIALHSRPLQFIQYHNLWQTGAMGMKEIPITA